jgi:hypothetical protein
MNSSAARLAAIWWPATGVVPSRAMKNDMKLKPVTSIRIDSPIGMPSRSCARNDLRSGACQPRPRSSKRA